MAAFAYRGRNPGGELVQGVMEGADNSTIAAQLSSSGIIPIAIDLQSATSAKPGEGFLAKLTKPKIQLTDLLLFSRQMYTLLKAGVPIMRALSGLQDSSVNVALKNVLQSLRDYLEGGRPLSAAMQKQEGVFSQFYLAMIYVGETTGRLEEVFLRLFHHLEFQEFMRAQVKAAVRYPSFVIITMAIAITVINFFVIPAFAKVYAGFKADLPILTRVLIGFSDFMVNYWWAMLITIAAAVVAFLRYTASTDGRLKWDRLKMRLPIAGTIVTKATLARFARSLSLALRSGLPVTQGLSLVAQTVDNAYMSSRIEKMREAVERGENLVRAAAGTEVFTPIVLQMLAVGDESGAVDDMMDEIAGMYQREVEYDLKNLSAQIEPILIIGLGILVLVLALGVFLPIWDLGKVAVKH
jgi:MSHA biogenesis protein MshG